MLQDSSDRPLEIELDHDRAIATCLNLNTIARRFPRLAKDGIVAQSWSQVMELPAKKFHRLQDLKTTALRC